MKRLVVCCDGTWNTSNQKNPTNVCKVSASVAERDELGVEQQVCYHEGVGSSPAERIRGGAFGWGLSRNVRV